jgi:carbamoyl-phosphate synthase large subunit
MNGIPAETVRKVSEGHPNAVDLIRDGNVKLIINTPSSRTPQWDEVAIRSSAIDCEVPLITTVSGASAAVIAIEALSGEPVRVKALQDYHQTEQERDERGKVGDL